jgi:hypothetical protein
MPVMVFATDDFDWVGVKPFRAGDTVRSQHSDEACVVIWTRGDWLWLDPIEDSKGAPFTARAHDYVLLRRGLA